MNDFNQLAALCHGKHIYIQTHNFPDPDAIASAFGLQRLLAQHEIPWENGFNWPLYGQENSPLSPLNIPYWKGAKEELDNAIYVLEQ